MGLIDQANDFEELVYGLERLTAEQPVSLSQFARALGLDPSTDFRHADLAGINLRGQDLSEFNFEGSDLTKADLRDTNIADHQIIGAILVGSIRGSARPRAPAPQPTRPADKRKATWILTLQATQDIRECFQTDVALFTASEVNAKTGKKIISRVPVKKDKIKDFVIAILDFLEDYKMGKIKHDGARHHEKDIRRAIEKYVPSDRQIDWQSLAEISDSGRVSHGS